MSVQKTRNAYFPSSGAAAGPAFDASWTDTSVAIVRPGIWDTPSGSADTLFSGSFSVAASPALDYILLAQFVFPAFGALMDFSAPQTGNQWLGIGAYEPTLMAYEANTLNAAIFNRQLVIRIFDQTNTLRYYMYGGPQVQGHALLYTTLKGVQFPAGSPGPPTFKATTQLYPTDYMVIEVGIKATSNSGLHGAHFDLSWQVGDGHSLYTTEGSVTPGNSGVVMTWWGAPTSSVAVAGVPPNGQLGVPYTATFTASGGTGPYTFAVISGALPDGLSLNTSTGVVSGTPTALGPFSFTIQATDSLANVGSLPASITIGGAVGVSGTPPSGQIGIAYSTTFTGVGGTGPYTFAISSPALPPGLSLNTSTGVVSGTPTLVGTFNFTVQATDALSNSGNLPTSILVTVPYSFSLSGAPRSGQVGFAYSTTFTPSGGTGPYTFSITSGALPGGLTLHAATGVVSGTPTATGYFGFTIRVIDSLGATASLSTHITIFSALVITLYGWKLYKNRPCAGYPLEDVETPPTVKRAV